MINVNNETKVFVQYFSFKNNGDKNYTLRVLTGDTTELMTPEEFIDGLAEGIWSKNNVVSVNLTGNIVYCDKEELTCNDDNNNTYQIPAKNQRITLVFKGEGINKARDILRYTLDNGVETVSRTGNRNKVNWLEVEAKDLTISTPSRLEYNSQGVIATNFTVSNAYSAKPELVKHYELKQLYPGIKVVKPNTTIYRTKPSSRRTQLEMAKATIPSVKSNTPIPSEEVSNKNYSLEEAEIICPNGFSIEDLNTYSRETIDQLLKIFAPKVKQ